AAPGPRARGPRPPAASAETGIPLGPARLPKGHEATRAGGVHVDLNVEEHGHGALVAVLLDGKIAFGPVAPELAEAFLRGVAVGAQAHRPPVGATAGGQR